MFFYCDDITSIIISDGVTSIGDYAFSRLSGLTSVTLPDSAASIGVAAFTDCGNIEDVYYGGSESDWALLMSDSSILELLKAIGSLIIITAAPEIVMTVRCRHPIISL